MDPVILKKRELKAPHSDLGPFTAMWRSFSTRVDEIVQYDICHCQALINGRGKGLLERVVVGCDKRSLRSQSEANQRYWFLGLVSQLLTFKYSCLLFKFIYLYCLFIFYFNLEGRPNFDGCCSSASIVRSKEWGRKRD